MVNAATADTTRWYCGEENLARDQRTLRPCRPTSDTLVTSSVLYVVHGSVPECGVYDEYVPPETVVFI